MINPESDKRPDKHRHPNLQIKIDTGHKYETVLVRNRIIITEIQNVMLSITPAKFNIISPVVLDPVVLDHLDLDNIFNDQLTGTTVTNVFRSI